MVAFDDRFSRIIRVRRERAKEFVENVQRDAIELMQAAEFMKFAAPLYLDSQRGVW